VLGFYGYKSFTAFEDFNFQHGKKDYFVANFAV